MHRYWVAQITDGYRPLPPFDPESPENRKQRVPIKKTKGGFKKKEDALAYCRTLKDTKPALPQITLKALYDAWDPWYSPRVDKDTFGCYRAAFAHFKPLHERTVREITAGDLQKCMDDCPAGKRTHENMKCIAGLLWHYAYDRELIDRDITENLYTGKGKKMKREPITEEELEVIRKAVWHTRYAEYVYAQCYLGFRPTEFLSLKKSDMKMINGQMCLIGGSKTDAGTDRVVPVPPVIREIIDIRLRQDGTDLLFPRAKLSRGVWIGWEPMTHEYYNKHIFKPLMQQLGIAEGKTPYCARHTYANKLKKAKVDDQVKASLIGHTEYAFTQIAYQSVTEKELKAAAKSIK